MATTGEEAGEYGEPMPGARPDRGLEMERWCRVVTDCAQKEGRLL